MTSFSFAPPIGESYKFDAMIKYVNTVNQILELLLEFQEVIVYLIFTNSHQMGCQKYQLLIQPILIKIELKLMQL